MFFFVSFEVLCFFCTKNKFELLYYLLSCSFCVCVFELNSNFIPPPHIFAVCLDVCPSPKYLTDSLLTSAENSRYQKRFLQFAFVLKILENIDMQWIVKVFLLEGLLYFLFPNWCPKVFPWTQIVCVMCWAMSVCMSLLRCALVFLCISVLRLGT